MNPLRYLGTCTGLGLILLSGCSSPHGQPQKGSELPAPSQVMDFRTLYSDNCAGCHGEDGRGGAAIPLADPVYLGIADDDTIRKVIAKGVPGTSMPAFSQSGGGMLTDQQIDVIIRTMRSQWSNPRILAGISPPSYAAQSTGNIEHGEIVYGTYCASCHGTSGGGTPKGSAITNDSFLALISNQGLRTIVIAGRPDLGAPDWRGNVPGKPMSDQEVTDVVAWLASRRVQNPGQPYSASYNGQH